MFRRPVQENFIQSGAKKFWAFSSSAFQNIFGNDNEMIFRRVKIRPPRFVSFTLELEPYSIKKAYALEVLNNINFNMLGTETINQTYTLNKNELIFTGKRIICVQEELRGDLNHQVVYKYWNIFFKDILRVNVEFYDKEIGDTISREEFKNILEDPTMDYKLQKHVLIVLKILYHYIDYDNIEQKSVDGGELGDLRMGEKSLMGKVKDLSLIKKVYRYI